MSSISDHVLKKFQTVAKTVKQELKRKGLVVPTKDEDGSVNLDGFRIVKDNSGFYVIKNKSGHVILDRINLPQSAAVLANGLALGKWADNKIYQLDQEYGFKMFELEVLRRNASASLKKNNFDRAEILYTKLQILKKQIETTKGSIVSSFEKLRNLH